MVILDVLAKDIEAKISDISYNLYGGNDDHPLFHFTDNVQIYQNRKLKKDGRRFTPGILRQIPGAPGPEQNWGVQSTILQLEIYGYREERDKVKEIFRNFIKDTNGMEYIPEQGYSIIEDDKVGVITMSDLIIDEFTSSDDGDDISGFTAFIDIIISVFVGGLSAKETSITIDGIPILFDEIQYKQDKSLIPNIEYKDSSETPNLHNKLVYELLTFNIPLNISPEVDNLLMNRALNPTYNDLFEIEWDLGIGTKTGQYVLRSAFIQYNQQQEAIGVLVSFENTSNIQEILIDGETIPILEFNFSSVRGTEAFNTETPEGNVEVLQTNVTYSYGIGMTILYDDQSQVLRELRSNILGNDRNTSHTITIPLPSETMEYDVILIDGTWQFTERANQTLQVSFVGEMQI